ARGCASTAICTRRASGTPRSRAKRTASAIASSRAMRSTSASSLSTEHEFPRRFREGFAPTSATQLRKEGLVATNGDRATAAVRVEGLCKRYGKIDALANVSFEVRRGECFGLLGPNGAGKTTTLSIVCSLARPDAGTVGVDGVDVARDPARARRSL